MPETTTERFTRPVYGEASPLTEGRHVALGRRVAKNDPLYQPLMREAITAGEHLWYEPESSDVVTTGDLLRLDNRRRNTLGSEAADADAVVTWTGYDTESRDMETTVHILTEQEVRTVRSETMSALVADIAAAHDRERTGHRHDGESLEAAARRLAAFVRRSR